MKDFTGKLYVDLTSNIYTCNKDIDNSELYLEFIGGNRYHEKIENIEKM